MIILLIITFITISIIGLSISKNIIKSIIFMNLLQTGVIMLFISISYNENNISPINITGFESFSDPLPQALMITAIVIGASITSLGLMFSIKLFHHFGSLDWDVIRKRMD
jgi:multicomponent Na+:H+ antiporter subunit C